MATSPNVHTVGNFSFISLGRPATTGLYAEAYPSVSDCNHETVLGALDCFEKDNTDKKILSFQLDKFSRLINGRHEYFVRGIYVHHEPLMMEISRG